MLGFGVRCLEVLAWRGAAVRHLLGEASYLCVSKICACAIFRVPELVIQTCASACSRFRRCWCLVDAGPYNNKLRCVQQACPHSRKRCVHELVYLCSKFAVERRHSTVINPMKSRDHPISVCCLKAFHLSSLIVASFKIFNTRPFSSMSASAAKSSK